MAAEGGEEQQDGSEEGAGLDEGAVERVALQQEQDGEYEAGLARDLMLAAAQKRARGRERKTRR
jgi:hypothetical protein